MEEVAKEEVAVAVVAAAVETIVDMEVKEVEIEQVPDEVKITTEAVTLELTPTKVPSPPPPSISRTIDDTENENTDTKLVPLSETENEEDIVCLDSSESDSESGASDSKRPRKEGENGDVMEVDENGGMTKEDKETVAKAIKKMKRSDLEDLVLAKCVEAVVAHTELGHLRQKVLEMQQQKDKMAGKMGVMMKQVGELSNAVNMIMENESRDPKNRVARPHVIRFNRSVGLQTSIEPSVRTAPPKIIRVSDVSQNGVKQYGGASVGKPMPPYAATNGTFGPAQAQAMKRVYQPGKPVDTKINILPGGQTATIQPSQRRVYSPAASGAPPRILPIAPKPPTPTQGVTVTPISQNMQPGIVDLTDDDPPSASTAPSTSATSSGTTIIGGVQYQIVNTNQSAQGRVQIVSPATQGQPKFIVTPTSTQQTRPVILQQLGSAGNQQIMLRGVNSSSPVTIIQRPMAPRSATDGSVPRIAATIPTRPPTGSVLAPSSNMPKRFILPALPVTPIAKVKNDMFRPPPKPELTLNEQSDGIVLSWNLQATTNMAEVTTYQIFACQEPLGSQANRPSQWKRVGDVKALPLPMACTLSQFTEENRYYFIVRGIDVYGRVGPFCDPQSILLKRKKL